jgi:pantetheine-phosphate adenylyltransferase
MKLALYPGTFDPITNGHLDVARRALQLFNKVVIGIAENPGKKPFFTIEERIDMARQSLDEIPGMERIEVRSFDSLTVNFARAIGASALIRGLRAVSDFEFELQIALTNRELAPDIESVFFMPSVDYIYLNSTMVKEVAKHGGEVLNFVPEPVKVKLRERFACNK